jgi:tripartite-type tricarboxylate transporter receptor subunit TctC
MVARNPTTTARAGDERRRRLLRLIGLPGAAGVLRGVPRLAGPIGAAATAAGARAQPWPTRPVRIVVPYGPGNLAEGAVRLIGQRVGERLGQPVVMEYKPGASGNIGIEHVARSAPDGHTLLFSVTALAINPALGKVGYDPLRDLTAIASLFQYRLVLAVRAGLGARNIDDLVAAIRRGRLTCGSAGGQPAIACHLLGSGAGGEVVHVPYKGMGPARQDLFGGTLDAMFDTPENAAAAVTSQRAIVLGTTGPAYRHPALGEVASLAQAIPALDLRSWVGLMAPAGTPSPVVARLNTEANAVLAEPEIARQLADWGFERMPLDPEQFASLVRREVARYARLVREAGLATQP